MSAEIVGAVAALGSAASWALGSVLFRRLGERIAPVPLTFAKGLAGSVLLGVAVLAVGFAPLDTETWALLIVSGLLGIAIGDALFFMALNRLGAHAVVVLFTLGQLLTVALGVWWLGESPSAADWIGIGAILGGVTTVMWAKIREPEGRTRLPGILYGLLAIAAMSVSIVVAKEALDSTDSVQATFVRMVSGTLGIMVLGGLGGGLASGLGALRHPPLLGFFAMSVAIVTFGGFWLTLVAIERIDVSIANTLNATEPLFVLPLAALVLKERIGGASVFGAVLTVIGIGSIVGPW